MSSAGIETIEEVTYVLICSEPVGGNVPPYGLIPKTE